MVAHFRYMSLPSAHPCPLSVRITDVMQLVNNANSWWRVAYLHLRGADKFVRVGGWNVVRRYMQKFSHQNTMHSNSYLPAFCLLCTNMLDRSLIRLEITHADYFTAILLDSMDLKNWSFSPP